jgi:hypothetical protein
MSRNWDFRTKTFLPYAKAIGEMTLAWNDFHMVLSSLFDTATKIPNRMIPTAVWNSQKADRTQRDMLKALIDLDVLDHCLRPEIRKEIGWILERATSLEDLRNDAIHAPLLEETDGKVYAWYQLGNTRAKKLAKKDLLNEFGWFYDTIIVLREYAAKLERIMWNSSEPVPVRPDLPNRAKTS